MGVIDGLDEAIREVQEVALAAQNVAPIMAEIANGAASEMRKNLVEERSQGSKMRALSSSYAARKRKRYPGKTILRATDQMLASIVAGSGPDYAEAGPTDEKARYHASPEPRSVIPLRDPFYVSKASTDAAEEALVDFVGPSR